MISINGKIDVYVLDLNEFEYDSFDFNVLSEYNGKYCHWWVDLISDANNISAKPYMTTNISIDINLENIKKQEFIILKNSYNERYKIVITPNLEAIREKEYIFKLGKNTISGKTISFSIISKENGKAVPWNVTYDGKPLSYDIVQLKTKLTLTLNSTIYNEMGSVIELTQEKSNKKIRIELTHKDSESVDIKKTD